MGARKLLNLRISTFFKFFGNNSKKPYITEKNRKQLFAKSYCSEKCTKIIESDWNSARKALGIKIYRVFAYPHFSNSSVILQEQNFSVYSLQVK